MNDYAIICESTADLSDQLATELGIAIIPMHFSVNNKEYTDYPDKRELSPKDFYDMQRNGKAATTSALGPAQYADAAEVFLKEEKDVLCLCLSSGISGTYNSALIAQSDLKERYPQRTFEVVDTKAGSLGQGLLAYFAAKNRDSGMSLLQNSKFICSKRDKLNHYFTVNDLHHLRRGGRISSFSAIAGTALSIKPILRCGINGDLVLHSKIRGRRQSLDKLVNIFLARGEDVRNATVFISHADAHDDAKYVEKQIIEKAHPKRIIIGTIGPVIGAHAGAGTVALFFLGDDKSV